MKDIKYNIHEYTKLLNCYNITINTGISCICSPVTHLLAAVGEKDNLTGEETPQDVESI